MSSPALSGLHHVTLPVSDLDASATWYEAVLGSVRLPAPDHHDPAGGRVSVVMTVPGLDVPLQLRLAPEAAAAVGGYDPLTLAVADRAALERWADHLDAVGAAHGPVAKARLGHALSFHDPDGTLLRLYTEPVGGLEVAAAEMGRPL